MHSFRPRALTGLLWMAATLSCQETPPELLAPLSTIPAPSNLSAEIGAAQLIVRWTADPDFDYSGFAVYRSHDDQQSYARLATVTAQTYTDTQIRDGAVYWYRIAGVDPDGVVGHPSSSIAVTAATYELQLNNGAAIVNDRTITLNFTAPATTQNVRFAEDSVATLSLPWRAYLPALALTLGAGDGGKRVFAQFRDAAGTPTRVVSAMITLDTFASIASLSFTPAQIAPSGTIHMTITPSGNERGGRVDAMIQGQGGVPIVVRDIGTGGDAAADDGVYERDYTLPASNRTPTIRLTAVFHDAAGNISEEADFPGTLKLTAPAAAVTLLAATDSTTSSIGLHWTPSTDVNFVAYEVYRDVSASISPGTSVLVARVTQSTAVNLTDTNLAEARTYYYAVYVLNDLGDRATSNVRALRTLDANPDAVVLDPPSSVGASRLTLTWSQNTNTDFESYRIFQSTTPGVINTGSPITTISTRETTFVDITGLDTTSNNYYYRVYVYDASGKTSRSNEVTTAVIP